MAIKATGVLYIDGCRVDNPWADGPLTNNGEGSALINVEKLQELVAKLNEAQLETLPMAKWGAE